MEFQNKNDYSVIVYGPSGFLAKYSYVGNIYKLVLFLNNKPEFRNWTAVNVYARRSGRFIVQYRPGQFVAPKPR